MKPTKLVGHCVISHRDTIQDVNKYFEQLDHYVIRYNISKGSRKRITPQELEVCTTCESKDASFCRVSQSLKDNKLKALELFSGKILVIYLFVLFLQVNRSWGALIRYGDVRLCRDKMGS